MLNNLINFLQMGDYGIYVWMSFFAFVAVFFGLWIVPFCQLKNQLKKYSQCKSNE